MQLFSRNKAIVALSLGALALGACGDDVTVPIAPNAPITLSITPPSASMNVGEAVNFAVQISGGPSTGGPTLASCTTSSATVATAAVSGSSCRVTAVAAGNATVTATASTGQSAAASVSVAAPAAAISGLQVSPSAANVQVNQTVTIVPTVNRGAGVTVAYTYASSTASVATVTAAGVVTAVAPGVATITVTATGTGTGFTSTTLTSAAAVTVTALPTGMTSLNVSPATLALAAGSTAQVVANAQQPTGAAAATITYGTTAPAVASVSSMGLVTAVGAGTAVITVTATSAANANFAAATLSGTVAVTVSPAAQISISSITNRLGEGVAVNDVKGQIQINTNLVTNGQLVTAVSAWICQVGETVPACAARSVTPAAQQSFGTGGAANGAVSLTINTADFTVASDFGSAPVKYNNGQNVVVATVTTAGGLNAANSNLAILNFTNVDGFAARHVAPTTTATSSGGVAYFGGPGANGRGSITIVPVTYTAGRTIKAATAGVPAGACAGSVAFTSAATPWTYTYGYTTATSSVSNSATNLICTGSNAALDVTAFVTGSTYTDNTAGPTATGAVETGTVANSFLTVSSSTTPVAAPASIRVDYAAPNADGALTPPTSGWVRASTRFQAPIASPATAGLLTLATDGGVGMPTTPNVRYLGCSGIAGDTATIALPTLTGSDIPECSLSNANTVYVARYYPADRLGNTAASITSTTFGVDKTAPQIRYSTGIADDRSINATTTNAFQVEALDERSGLTTTATAVSTSLTRTLRRSTSLASSGWASASDNFCNGAAAGTGSFGFGALFISAPNCSVSANTAWSGSTTVDGYSISTPVTVAAIAAADGYYTYSARVADEAGNTATVVRRAIMQDATAPAVTAVAAIAPITSTYAGPFTGTFQDNVESRGTGLRIDYGALQLAYPMQATSAVAFDDMITRDSLFSGTTPFTSGVRLYTDLETTAAGVPQGTAVQLVGPGLYAQNFGGVGASGFASFLAGSITFDAVTWGTKSSGLANFAVVASTASFNSPEGGLKAQVVGPANTFNTPFSRVDFYRQIGATSQWEYVGSVDATATPCISVSQTCNVYIGENASTTQRVITYVLRAGGTGAVSFDVIPFNNGTYIAIGTTGTSGRGLLSATSGFAPPPPASRR